MPRGTLTKAWNVFCRNCQIVFKTLTPGSKYCSAKCRKSKWLPYSRAFKKLAVNKLKARDAHLQRTYNISLRRYEELLLLQGGGCAICGRKNSGVPGQNVLHVDHDSKTGHVRGILCQMCNTGIGSFAHASELLIKASLYVHTNEEFLNES